MKHRIACALAVPLLTLTLAGCSSNAEIPVAPADAAAAAEQAAAGSNAEGLGGYTLTDAAKLKDMSVGETASWAAYEVTIDSINRADGLLSVNLTVKSHADALSLSTECLLSFGMPSVDSTFADGIIAVAAGESASGTISFDDRYSSERLFWNDGATEATWMLDKAPVQSEGPQQDEKKDDGADDAQKQAVKNIESRLPDLFANNTYYVFQSVDTAQATVEKLDDGGYSYANSVSILDGNGDPATVNVNSSWNEDGTDCTYLEMDGAQLF